MSAGSSDGRHQALVDAHVHFHPGFDELRFFRSAMANFATAGRALEIRGAWTGILVLTEGAGSDAFQRFLDGTSKTQSGPLILEATEENGSISIRDEERNGDDDARMVMVAGRQIRTAEDLEVLGLPMLDPPPEGLPLEETISLTVGMGAVAILPWGFGKWSSGRGKLIARTLKGCRPGGFLLADTGHRPRLASYPGLLRRGEAASIPVLIGSDPLPLPGEDRRPGSCCSALLTEELGRTPGLALKRAIKELSGSPPRFREPPGVFRFALTQVAMQFRKRSGWWRP